MKNVTICLDEEVVRWARIRAAAREISLSRLVEEILREKIREEDFYNVAKEQYLAQPAIRLKDPAETYPRRDELHER